MPLPTVQASAAGSLRHLTAIWKPGFRGLYLLNFRSLLIVRLLSKPTAIMIIIRVIFLSRVTLSILLVLLLKRALFEQKMENTIATLKKKKIVA